MLFLAGVLGPAALAQDHFEFRVSADCFPQLQPKDTNMAGLGSCLPVSYTDCWDPSFTPADPFRLS